ncbi:GFA family protein [Pseudooceanicola sp. C21-150M6]|uniref:GFA family protein n=1 Tax=Pseudooceanicola sp. C21-150M6 TaxID=3434355 RepID=UPI003D7FA3C0
MVTGHCLCGAVTVRLDGALPGISACHCDYCTRWGGGLQMGFDVPAAQVTVTGPVKSHRSSPLAERAWCDTCGSSLWLRDYTSGAAGSYEICPGLFENAAGLALDRVVYADRHPTGFWLEGSDVTRISKEDYEAVNPHLHKETTP